MSPLNYLAVIAGGLVLYCFADFTAFKLFIAVHEMFR